MLRLIFTFFSLLICVIRLYGDSQFHKAHIFCIPHSLSSIFTLNILWILFFVKLITDVDTCFLYTLAYQSHKMTLNFF